MEINNEPLLSEKVTDEGKRIYLDLYENERGVYCRITERTGEQKRRVIIGSEAFGAFTQAILRIEDEIRHRA